jgi:hypothetical protein
MTSAVALAVLAVLAAVWWIATTLGALRTRPWMRGSALTLQLIFVAVGIGCFQGLTAVPAIGWALLIPALVGIALILSPPVIRATTKADATGDAS